MKTTFGIGRPGRTAKLLPAVAFGLICTWGCSDSTTAPAIVSGDAPDAPVVLTRISEREVAAGQVLWVEFLLSGPVDDNAVLRIVVTWDPHSYEFMEIGDTGGDEMDLEGGDEYLEVGDGYLSLEVDDASVLRSGYFALAFRALRSGETTGISAEGSLHAMDAHDRDGDRSI